MTTINFSAINSVDLNLDETPFNPFSKHHISLFGKPIEIGHFSVNENKELSFDKSQMKYLITNLHAEDLNLDLNVDYSPNLSHQYVTIEKLYQLLHWIVNKKAKLNVDFVTVRGTLTRIMCTPYTEGFYRNEWEICASKYKGVIYLSAIDTERDILENYDFPNLHRFQSWGYKFEQYLTTTEIDGEPDLKPVNNHEEFCIVLKNRFNDFNLLYQAEIDAVIPHYISKPESGDTSCYIELKVARILSRTSDVFKFCSHKLTHFWAQSYLTGISDIICGRRTPDGIVKFLDTYNVSNIPEMAYGLWSSETCLNFCNKFLKMLKKIVTEDNPDIVYNFMYDGKGTINCRKLVNPEAKYKIIPEWYKKAVDEFGEMQ